jgi:NADPH2:quinone reductase
VHAWIPNPAGHGAALVQWAEVEPPEPAVDEVTVAVEAYSVNRGETLLLERPRVGWRPGKDVAGVVVRAAADGRSPAVGVRVLGHPPAGGWAEQVAVPVKDLTVLPDEVHAVTAAALPLAGLTALRLLRQAGSLVGRRLLVTGASGGVGHYVVELAAAGGAHVTALSASPERGKRLLALGARTVQPQVPPDQPEYDVVMESVGGETLRHGLSRLRPGGLLLWFGQAGRKPASVDFFDFFDGPVQATVQHFDYTYGRSGYGEDLATLVDLVATGRLHPELGLVRDWTETPSAIEALRARQVRGNVVLVVGSHHLSEEEDES